MKWAVLVLCILLIAGCSKKPSLSAEDVAYIHTTVDLLRTRANFGSNMDSAHVAYSLDSVYQRDHTTGEKYRDQSASLANDPQHAAVVFDAINDSIAKK